MEQKKGVFYGCIYDDEKENWKSIVEDQFKNCSEKAKRNDMEIVKWGFDVMVKEESLKLEIENFVKECAKNYFPNVSNIKLLD